MVADIVVIGIVAVCILRGYKSGFLKSLINIAAYIVSIVL